MSSCCNEIIKLGVDVTDKYENARYPLAGMGFFVSAFAFNALVGAAVKYGLVSVSKGKLKTEPLYVDMKLAYDDEQKNRSMRQAFLTPPLFANLAKRLEGKPIPEYLDKLMLRKVRRLLKAGMEGKSGG